MNSTFYFIKDNVTLELLIVFILSVVDFVFIGVLIVFCQSLDIILINPFCFEYSFIVFHN